MSFSRSMTSNDRSGRVRQTILGPELLPPSIAAIRRCYAGVTRPGAGPMAHATTSISAGLARAMRRRLDVLADELPRARRSEVKGVHRARVASRRLREALAAIE